MRARKHTLFAPLRINAQESVSGQAANSNAFDIDQSNADDKKPYAQLAYLELTLGITQG